MLNQTQPSESSRFKLKIIPVELEEIKRKGSQFESLEGFWDPIEKEEIEVDEVEIDPFWLQRSLPRIMKFIRENVDLDELSARRFYHGEEITPIFQQYNCWIPASCFKKARFNEAWMNYRANFVEMNKGGELSILFYKRCHVTNKSVLVRSQLEFEVEGLTGSYSVANTLSEQDLVDFLSVNFVHLKRLMKRLESQSSSEERIHKLACMFTAVRYVALVQGYLGNDSPGHWEIVEEVTEKISEEIIKEIISMKSDVHQLIIATTAEWWTADFSVGAIGQFPPLLKKMLLNLETLKPIFKDFMPSESEMQEIIHKAIHLVNRRNVLKAMNMDNPEWTGEIPMGLPVIKKIDLEKLAISEIVEMFKRVPAGNSSYGNCHKILEIMKKYKLSKFIFYKDEAKLVESVMKEINEKPNYHHINSSYLNKNFQQPKRFLKDKIQNIVLECGIFLSFTKCHLGLLKSPIFQKKIPLDLDEILKVCPNWLLLLRDFISDRARIEEIRQFFGENEYEKDPKNHPFSMSITSVLIKQFASTFSIKNGYIYWKNEHGIRLLVGSADKSGIH